MQKGVVNSLKSSSGAVMPVVLAGTLVIIVLVAGIFLLKQPKMGQYSASPQSYQTTTSSSSQSLDLDKDLQDINSNLTKLDTDTSNVDQGLNAKAPADLNQ